MIAASARAFAFVLAVAAGSFAVTRPARQGDPAPAKSPAPSSGAPTPAPASPPSPSCDIQTTERIVAVADVHGAYDRFVGILRKADIIDDSNHWSGGRAVLIQLGDVVDRGPASRKALDLLRQLEGEAARAGGQVHALLGNHELMRLMNDYRYVSAAEYAEFQSPDASALRERYYQGVLSLERARLEAAQKKVDVRAFEKQLREETPLGMVEMATEFAPTGTYGRWLRGHDVMARANGFAFLHGGTTRAVAAMGCAAINEQARSELQNLRSFTLPQIDQSLVAGENGPLWFRGLSAEDSPLNDGDVDAILGSLGVQTIVVGHTVAPDARVRWRFGRRVVQLDSGMLDGDFFPGGSASALEISDGSVTVIYENRRDKLK